MHFYGFPILCERKVYDRHKNRQDKYRKKLRVFAGEREMYLTISVEYVVDPFKPKLHYTDLLWICCTTNPEQPASCTTCCGFVVDLLRICCGFVVDLLWICCTTCNMQKLH